MTKYVAEFNQLQVDNLTKMLNVAVKAEGILGNADVVARELLSLIIPIQEEKGPEVKEIPAEEVPKKK